MALPDDVTGFLRQRYPGEQQAKALHLLENARLEDGRRPEARLLRCAVFAGRGDLNQLERMIALLAIDWRDVIVAGEYEIQEKTLVSVRDLSQPFGAS